MVSILLCSVDSFLAALGLGTLGCSESNRRTLILAFAACDFGATLVGTCLHSSLVQIRGDGSNSFLVTVLLAVVLAAVLASGSRGPIALLGVPVLLSFDNFIVAYIQGPNHTPQFLLFAGIASGLAAWAGFAAARCAGSRWSKRCAVVAGGSLLILAFVLSN